MKQCQQGGIDLWWCDEREREEVKELIGWLKDFEMTSMEDDKDEGSIPRHGSLLDLAWATDSYYSNNAYLITGAEGKTSLVTHLATSLRVKLIEINNADQSITHLVNYVQEATQSRVLRSSFKKSNAAAKLVCSRFPVLLLDDVDANVLSASAFVPQPSASIADLTTLDVWHARQKPATRSSYLKAVKQLIQASKAPILLTTARPSVRAPRFLTRRTKCSTSRTTTSLSRSRAQHTSTHTSFPPCSPSPRDCQSPPSASR